MPAPGDTQVIDLHDVELVMAASQKMQAEAEHQRSLPPPLPPEVQAAHAPAEPRVSQPPPASHAPSIAPPAPAPRSTTFYVVALLAFLLVGVGGGLAVAMTFRKPPAAPAAAPGPTGKAQAVITIPTVEVDDDPDGGK